MLNACLLASLRYDQCLGFFDLFQQSQAGELHKLTISLGDYPDDNPWRFDCRLCWPSMRGLSVRGKRMFLMPFHIYFFAFFGGEAVTYPCVFLSTWPGLEVKYGLEEFGWQTTSTQHSSESHTGCSEEEVLLLFVKVCRKTNSNRE